MLEEFELLQKLIPASPGHPDVVIGNGDDAAVIRAGDRLIAVTTDAVVEGVHFNLDYFTLRQVGSKAVESAASDVVAMGTYPEHLVLTFCIPSGFSEEQVGELFGGCRDAALRLGCSILGGDTTRSPAGLTVNVTVFGGFREKGSVLTRAGVRPGQLLFLSGPVGMSAAGLELLGRGRKEEKELIEAHLSPRCRPDFVPVLQRYAAAAIDVSDGLSSEAHHLAAQSGCKLVIDEAALPIPEAILRAAGVLKKKLLEYVLSSGEEYQILFSVPPEFASSCPGVKIGAAEAGEGVFLKQGASLTPLPRLGFDHFASF